MANRPVDQDHMALRPVRANTLARCRRVCADHPASLTHAERLELEEVIQAGAAGQEIYKALLDRVMGTLGRFPQIKGPHS